MTAERPGTPGTAWETALHRMAEVVVPEDDGAPLGWDTPGDSEHRPNRASRRAAKHAARTQAPKDAPRPSSENPYSETRPS